MNNLKSFCWIAVLAISLSCQKSPPPLETEPGNPKPDCKEVFIPGVPCYEGVVIGIACLGEGRVIQVKNAGIGARWIDLSGDKYEHTLITYELPEEYWILGTQIYFQFQDIGLNYVPCTTDLPPGPQTKVKILKVSSQCKCSENQ